MADLYNYLLSQKAEGWHLLGSDVVRSLCDHIEDWIEQGHCVSDQEVLDLEEQIAVLEDEVSEKDQRIVFLRDQQKDVAEKISMAVKKLG